MTLPPEFALIARHFLPLAGEGALGLSDDAALLDLPPGRQLVLAADAMVAGVHFLPDDPPDTLIAFEHRQHCHAPAEREHSHPRKRKKQIYKPR